jgi:signal transduction histidine kinase
VTGAEDEVRRHLARNYTAQLVHGMLAMTGFRLVNTPTFLPAYLHTLSGSDLTVGLIMAAQNFGAFLSSIGGAVAVEHRARVLPLGFFYGWMMRASILALALAGFFLTPGWALPALAVALFFLGVFGGMQNVLFNVLLSKTIPADRRGRLLGLRFFLGGLTASFVAWFGGQVLVQGNALGNGYASTFLLAFGLTAIGLSLLTLVHEPASSDVRAPSSLRARLKDIPGLMAADPNFARYFLVQALATAGMAAAPFYILGAGQKLSLTGSLLGTLSFVLLASQTLSHLLWGWLGDARGFRVVLLAALMIWSAGAFALAFADSVLESAAAFVALGAGMAGFQLGSQNIVFDFRGPQDLPMRLALVNSSQALIQGLGALTGGQLAALTSYPLVFALAAAVKLAAAAILWFTVREPRAARAKVGPEPYAAADPSEFHASQSSHSPEPGFPSPPPVRGGGMKVRIQDLLIVGGASILALAVLAIWTQEWLFAGVLALGVLGLAAARLAFVRVSHAQGPAQAAPVPSSSSEPHAIADFAALAGCLPDPALVVDQEGRILAGNALMTRHFGPIEPRKHVANVIRAPAVLDALDAVLVGAPSRTAEFTVLSSPEQSFEAHVAGGGFQGGKPEFVMVVLRDVTKAKRIEDMRADFVANASHELRTPLASLTGFIDTLRGAAKDDAPARERFLTIMSEQAARMRRLIDDLLSLSRIELNEHIKPLGQVNLGDVVEEVTGALQPLAMRAEMTITVDEPATLPHVSGDREEIVQVVQNLVDNAIKYGRKGGQIQIQLALRRAQPGEPGPTPAVAVSVKDDGEGIAREHIPRLTERFYRVDVRRSREVGGTGLGLAIVKHIVNRHRGRLAIDSKQGEGSTFSVFLPLATIGDAENDGLARLPPVAKKDNPQE